MGARISMPYSPAMTTMPDTSGYCWNPSGSPSSPAYPAWESRTHALRYMLTHNNVPFEFHPVDSEEGDKLVEDFGVDAKRLPAVIRHDGSVLHDPTFAEVAGSHGIHTRPSSEVYDLAILGAGPAGLAPVYGASEGLSTLVVEQLAIGGQA
jgi:thioredoxin reductase (NADPH)